MVIFFGLFRQSDSNTLEKMLVGVKTVKVSGVESDFLFPWRRFRCQAADSESHFEEFILFLPSGAFSL